MNYPKSYPSAIKTLSPTTNNSAALIIWQGIKARSYYLCNRSTSSFQHSSDFILLGVHTFWSGNHIKRLQGHRQYSHREGAGLKLPEPPHSNNNLSLPSPSRIMSRWARLVYFITMLQGWHRRYKKCKTRSVSWPSFLLKGCHRYLAHQTGHIHQVPRKAVVSMAQGLNILPGLHVLRT